MAGISKMAAENLLAKEAELSVARSNCAGPDPLLPVTKQGSVEHMGRAKQAEGSKPSSLVFYIWS